MSLVRLSILIVALGLTLTACDEPGTASEPAAPPPAVTVVPAVESEVVESVRFVGRVKAVDEVDIRARVEGFLQERAFQEGQDVEAGALLYVIEPDIFEADLDLQKARLAQAAARLKEAELTLQRSLTLLKRGNVSQAQVDENTAAQQSAAAEVQAQKSLVRQAEIALGYTKILAPISGHIGESRYSVGDLVGPQSEVLARVTMLDPIHVTFNISERDFVEIRRQRVESGLARNEKVGESVTPSLILPDGSPYAQTGEIDFFDERVEQGTGTLAVRAVFPNPEGLLAPGQFVSVVISGNEPERKLVVPQSAVQQDQQGRFVLVVTADNLIEQRRVSVGTQRDAMWIVDDGLAPGDLVVIEGVQKVRPGVKVEPVVVDAKAAG